MADETGSHDLVDRLRNGESEAWSELWELYGSRLERVLETRIPHKFKAVVSASDILISSFRTFYRRMKEGQFDVSASDDLWRLLCTIALYKAFQQHRRHLTNKRDIRKQTSLSGADGITQDVTDPRSLPKADAVAEKLSEILESMNEKEQQVVGLMLQGCTQIEAAKQLGCSDRWIRIVLSKLKARWKDELES
jgi:RNA polymerase sigma factor (sigma-70 family)